MNLTSPTSTNIDKWLFQEMVAKGGKVFRPLDSNWKLDPTAESINVEEAKKAVPQEYQPWFVAALAYSAMEYSARSMKGISTPFRLCAKNGLNVLDEGDALAIRDSLSKHDYCLLRSFLRRWRDEYSLTVCPNKRLIEILFKLKPIEKKTVCPVESMDPVKGPYTELETQAIFNWANDAYAFGRLPIEKLIYIRLLIATGARKRQLQQLVFGDIINSAKEVILRVPKAKDRSFEYRSGFQSFHLSSDLYELLSCYQRMTLHTLQGKGKNIDWVKAIKNVPVFRSARLMEDTAKTAILDTPLRFLEKSPQEEYHKPDSSMKDLLSNLSKDKSFPISERTKERIHLASHRFRYTLGTDMARQGLGVHVIASALGHKRAQSAGRYIKTSPAMAKRLNDKMIGEIALVVNAFQGKLVDGVADALNGSDPNKIIRGSSGTLATCGASGGCQLDAPVACYTCSKFQPWIDGPHEEVLERLQLRRRRAIDSAGADSAAAISFDRPILAVAQVVHRIRSLKEGQING